MMIHQPFMVPALLIGLFSLPLAFHLVPRNGFYGIRTSKTLGDDAVWYPANRLGGWLFLAASCIYVLFALLRPTTGSHDPRFGLWLAHLLFFVLPLAASLAVVLRHVRRL